MQNNNVEKTPYGYNIKWTETEDYVSKILVFEELNSRTPISFHKETTKSWFINSGKFKITWIDTKNGQIFEKEFGEGTVFHVPACTPCGLQNLTTNASIAETSNKDPIDDTFVLSNT